MRTLDRIALSSLKSTRNKKEDIERDVEESSSRAWLKWHGSVDQAACAKLISWRGVPSGVSHADIIALSGKPGAQGARLWDASTRHGLLSVPVRDAMKEEGSMNMETGAPTRIDLV